MAENFYSTYNGDILSLNYILPTVDAKSVFIPGLTTAFDVTVAGQTAFYYESETFDLSDGDAGRKLDLATTGAKRKSFNLEKSYGIGGIIPLVGHATVSEDVIGRKLVDSANGVVAWDNKTGLKAMVEGDADKVKGIAKTYTATGDGVSAYTIVIDAVKEFNKANAVTFVESNDAYGEKVRKAKGGWRATTLIVGPEFYAMLQKCEEFSKWAPGQTQFSANEALVGRVGGLDVVYTTELEGADFIVMNPNGFLAPKGVSATEVFDKVEGRPGAILAQSEMVYGFKVLDANQIHVYNKQA